MSKCADAIAEMNSLGAKRIPFLFVLDFDLSEPFVCPLADVCPENILFDISGISNFAAPADISPLSDFRKRLVPISVYGDAFRRVREHLFHGDTYLLNLTFSTPVDTSMTLRQIFHCSRARYRLFFFDRFTVFSPECFVKIGDNSISSYPMKSLLSTQLLLT
jgi:para-aminobenzoate synthetase component 1